MKQKRLLDQVGLRLSRQALRVLKERGIFAHSPVSLEHQHLAKRYVVRGLESGGAVGDLGRYVTFAREDGQRNRVSASGRGNRSERSSCGRRGAGAGENRDAAQGTDLRTVDYPALAGRGKRRQATSTGDESLCFVAFTGGWSWICPERTRTKPVLYCRRFTHWPVKKSQSQNGFKRRSAPSRRR